MTEIHRRTNPGRVHFPASYVSWSRSGIPQKLKNIGPSSWVSSLHVLHLLPPKSPGIPTWPCIPRSLTLRHGFLCGKWKMNQEKSSNHRNLRKKIQPNHWSNGKSNSPMLVGGSCPPPSCCDPLLIINGGIHCPPSLPTSRRRSKNTFFLRHPWVFG